MIFRERNLIGLTSRIVIFYKENVLIIIQKTVEEIKLEALARFFKLNFVFYLVPIFSVCIFSCHSASILDCLSGSISRVVSAVYVDLELINIAQQSSGIPSDLEGKISAFSFPRINACYGGPGVITYINHLFIGIMIDCGVFEENGKRILIFWKIQKIVLHNELPESNSRVFIIYLIPIDENLFPIEIIETSRLRKIHLKHFTHSYIFYEYSRRSVQCNSLLYHTHLVGYESVDLEPYSAESFRQIFFYKSDSLRCEIIGIIFVYIRVSDKWLFLTVDDNLSIALHSVLTPILGR